MIKESKYKQFLKDRNLQAKDVVKGTGLSKARISGIANNTSNPTLLTIKILCRFHECSPNDIVDWEKWLPPQNPDRKTEN